ncbi:hypothetical protein FACS189459_2140 [Bacilli bacterium]|nr:hypothetical protein FACS189459_2140 [Bacilli bacterium]
MNNKTTPKIVIIANTQGTIKSFLEPKVLIFPNESSIFVFVLIFWNNNLLDDFSLYL